jgi:hypothetical protein
MSDPHDHDPLSPQTHEPNSRPPSDDPTFTLSLPDGTTQRISVEGLRQLPPSSISACYIVSTGHGTSGPFTFTGACLIDLIAAQLGPDVPWTQVEVISADGFGNRVRREELISPGQVAPILLSYTIDDQPLTREQGLVRMIVPSETDDALRQVKWVGQVRVKDDGGQGC